MQLDEAIAKFVLGLLSAENLPAIGIQALEAGYDSPSLRQLAGVERCDADVVRNLFAKALQEIGLVVPTPSEAGLSVAKAIAKEVLAGRAAPYEGAKQIWAEVYVRFPQLSQLRPFVGLASEYEDDDIHRDEYIRDIMEECRRLSAG